jgi:hypothetical protein
MLENKVLQETFEPKSLKVPADQGNLEKEIQRLCSAPYRPFAASSSGYAFEGHWNIEIV